MIGSALRQVARASSRTGIGCPTGALCLRPAIRNLWATPAVQANRKNEDSKHDEMSTAGKQGAFEEEGQFSRTDQTIRVEYPGESSLPSSRPVQGRGGSHFKKTLASFSLEDKVGVVTGGARGLGLVMSQAQIASGADLALVDLNRNNPFRSLDGTTTR